MTIIGFGCVEACSLDRIMNTKCWKLQVAYCRCCFGPSHQAFDFDHQAYPVSFLPPSHHLYCDTHAKEASSMGGRGGRSKGCYSCRKRKVKCGMVSLCTNQRH